MARPETNEGYFDHPDVVAEYASFDFLLEPESVILKELGSHLESARMLDLGVGGGRTTVHFAPRVKEYVGLDSSARMIRACELRFRDRIGPKLAFVAGDVRNLSPFAAASFDFVLFAFNGIDSLCGHADRLRALREIYRVCAPGGIFFFSSDNLLHARTTLSVWRALRTLLATERYRENPLLLLARPTLMARTITRPLQLRRLNAQRLRGGHAVYVYLRPRYELSTAGYAAPAELIEIEGYAIEPREQLVQLSMIGFEETRIMSPEGQEVTEEPNSRLKQWQWLYYLCRKHDR
jgi:SAM-dependent methyltransferase